MANGGKWLQNALRALCKCAILLFYSTPPLWSSGLMLFISASDDPPLQMRDLAFANRSDIILHTGLHVGGTHCGWTAPSLPAHAQSHARMRGGTGSALLHRLAWLIQAWAPISTRACGSVGLPWSVPHLKPSIWGFFINCDDFVIAMQRFLLRTPQWISVIVVSFPSLPPQMQSTNPLKKERSFDSQQKLLSAKGIRNSLA